MAAIITDQFRRNSAATVLADIAAGDNTYYIGIGKTDPWPDSGGYTESDLNFVSPIPTGSALESKEVRNNLLSLIKVSSEKARLIIPNVPWKVGNKHKAYAQNDPTCFVPTTVGPTTTYPCYAIADGKIWLSLKTDGSSTLANTPSGQALYTEYTGSTGYTWIAIANVEIFPAPFNTDQFIAVKLDENQYDDGAGQTNNNATKGRVYGFNIVSGGTGYTFGSANTPTTGQAVLIGDGTSSQPVALTLTRNSGGNITNVEFTSTNSTLNFVNGSVKIYGTAGGSGAIITVSIAPIDGFGPSILNNLPTWFLGLAADFDGTVGGDAQVLSYRQISLIKNPTVDIANDADVNSADALKYLTITGSPTITAVTGDIITQSGSGAPAKAFFDSYSNGKMYYHQNDSTSVNHGKFTASGSVYINEDSGTPYSYSAVHDSEYTHNTGEVLFIEQRKPVSRNINQKEEVKLVIQF